VCRLLINSLDLRPTKNRLIVQLLHQNWSLKLIGLMEFPFKKYSWQCLTISVSPKSNDRTNSWVLLTDFFSRGC
jgi:hypothetical protein